MKKPTKAKATPTEDISELVMELSEGKPVSVSVTGEVRARDLLQEFLGAADMIGAQEQIADTALNPRRFTSATKGTPMDAKYYEAHESELEKARPVLEKLVRDVNTLARFALVRGVDREKASEKVMLAWNEAILLNKWTTLPPLCTRCGRPVLVRGLSTTTCSTKCGDAVSEARKKAAKRKR